jgi:hypothetical protein
MHGRARPVQFPRDDAGCRDRTDKPRRAEGTHREGEKMTRFMMAALCLAMLAGCAETMPNAVNNGPPPGNASTVPLGMSVGAR